MGNINLALMFLAQFWVLAYRIQLSRSHQRTVRACIILTPAAFETFVRRTSNAILQHSAFTYVPQIIKFSSNHGHASLPIDWQRQLSHFFIRGACLRACLSRGSSINTAKRMSYDESR